MSSASFYASFTADLECDVMLVVAESMIDDEKWNEHFADMLEHLLAAQPVDVKKLGTLMCLAQTNDYFGVGMPHGDFTLPPIVTAASPSSKAEFAGEQHDEPMGDVNTFDASNDAADANAATFDAVAGYLAALYHDDYSVLCQNSVAVVCLLVSRGYVDFEAVRYIVKAMPALMGTNHLVGVGFMVEMTVPVIVALLMQLVRADAGSAALDDVVQFAVLQMKWANSSPMYMFRLLMAAFDHEGSHQFSVLRPDMEFRGGLLEALNHMSHGFATAEEMGVVIEMYTREDCHAMMCERCDVEPTCENVAFRWIDGMFGCWAQCADGINIVNFRLPIDALLAVLDKYRCSTCGWFGKYERELHKYILQATVGIWTSADTIAFVTALPYVTQPLDWNFGEDFPPERVQEDTSKFYQMLEDVSKFGQLEQ